MLKIVLAGVVVAVIGGVFPTDLGPIFVDATLVIVLKKLTASLDCQVPLVVFDEDVHAFMGQVPSDVVKLFGGIGLVDLQSKVSAAQGGAAVT